MEKASVDFVEKLHHGPGQRVFYFEKRVVNGQKKSRTVRGKSGEPSDLWTDADSYVSMNNYKEGAADKSAAQVESINGFFIDIDICHRDKVFDEKRADFLRERCMALVDEKLGKRYTCYCCSGRGIALYYLYNAPIRTDLEDMVEAHRRTYRGMINAFRSALKVYIDTGDVEVDGTVTDFSRVVRIPGTRNNGAGRDAFVVEEDWNRVYPPEMLFEMFAPFATAQRKRKTEKKCSASNLETRRQALRGKETVTISGKNPGVIPAVYLNNAAGICKAIEKIVSERTMVEGSLRNNILFIYYNNLKLLCLGEPQKAVEETVLMNASFHTPLEGDELAKIIDSVDTHVELSGVHGDGFYLFSRQRVAEMIEMTEEEIALTGFFRSKEKRGKAKKNKQRTRKDEEEIRRMLNAGASWRQIASKTGRSNSFIGRVVASWKSEKEDIEFKEFNEFKEEKTQGKEDFLEKRSDLANKQEGERGAHPLKNGGFQEGEQKGFLDEELLGVINLLMSGQNTYISGKGGTGKSLVGRAFVKKMEEAGKKVLVVAPSGLAALSVGGKTVHSAFCMDASEVFGKNSIPHFRSVKSLREVDAVLVDECGMLRIDHFTYLVKAIKSAERKYRKRIQLVMVGDFLQIRPVVTNKEKQKLVSLYYDDIEFKAGAEEAATRTYQAYEAEELWRSLFFAYTKLTKNRRQENSIFAQFMDKAREGDTSCVLYFSQFERKGFDYAEDGYVHLCAYRSDARRINEKIIERHRGDESFRTFENKVGCKEVSKRCQRGGLRPLLPPLSPSSEDGVNAPLTHLLDPSSDSLKAMEYRTQSFYKGMPVIATMNHKKDRYRNGQMGTVVGVSKNEVSVAFQDGGIIRVRKALVGGSDFSLMAFPLLPAYAITIHKCQSQTFEKVVVHGSTNGKRSMFEEGQMYVALSRVKSPEGLVICGHITEGDIERPCLAALREGTSLRDYEKNAILF